MDDDKKYELGVLSGMMHVCIFCYSAEDDKILFSFPGAERKKIYNLALIRKMCLQSSVKSRPIIHREQENIYYGILLLEEKKYIIVGPVITTAFGFAERWKFLYENKIVDNEEVVMPQIQFITFIQLMTVVAYTVAEQKVTVEEIIELNQLQKYAETEKKTEETDEDAVHHTYGTERLWAESMKEGDARRAKELIENMIGITGKLSEDPLTNSKYIHIAIATLSTRLALENGVPSARAYKTSDTMINRMDRCRNEKEVWEAVFKTIDVFTEMISEARSRKKYSGYVEQCKYYIDQHYRQNLSLNDLSEYTGMNGAYLSHLFSQIEGMTIKDYLNKVRIERAQNLLKYSDRSIIEISDYIGFQTQSYFGRIFKKYTGKTPARFRGQYQIKEFRKEEKNGKDNNR